jgi:hypothetical protein
MFQKAQIYRAVAGSYEHTTKNKIYRVNEINIKSTSGGLDINLLVLKKLKGK